MSKNIDKRIEQKRKLVEIKGGRCSICGYDKNLSALDFHHKNPSEKEGLMGVFINNHKFKDAENEAEKCLLMCKNCHSEFHNPHLAISVTDGNAKILEDNLGSINKSCSFCGKYSGGQKFCSTECYHLMKRKVKNRPSKLELSDLLKEMSWCAIGRKYKVSDNAVRKWARSYELIK